MTTPRSRELDNRLSILVELGRQLPFEEIDRLHLTAIDDPDAFKSEVQALVLQRRARLSRRVQRRLRRQQDAAGAVVPG